MKVSSFVASGAGSGYAPRAPGTAGSLVGLLFGALLLPFGHLALLFGIIVASIAGIWAIGRGGSAALDPGWIVIDEIAGQMIAMIALHRISIIGLILAFALFRLFDITKWGPIGWADQRHDEWGVMGDDWLAGVAAALVIAVLRLVLPL